MHHPLELRPYYRQFQRPLETSHGIWRIRAGLILRLTDAAGRVAFGEVAPLPWFGSETLEQARACCRQWVDRSTPIPADRPACQFGLESAWEDLEAGPPIAPPQACSALLPTGAAALEQGPALVAQGYTTLKWKIGVGELARELVLLEQLVQHLPASVRLRLDANGGLTRSQAARWLHHCDQIGSQIELLEQPLAPSQFAAMVDLSRQFRTPLALDESVATLAQLQHCYHQGWRGIFVIKPAIAGSPQQLRRFCRQTRIDGVFSTVFETAIGRRMGLRLAGELGHPQRAIGYGVEHWFVADAFSALTERSGLADLEQVWQTLAPG